jgi:hypothetical protein
MISGLPMVASGVRACYIGIFNIPIQKVNMDSVVQGSLNAKTHAQSTKSNKRKLPEQETTLKKTAFACPI